jgi:hypothetical protein
MKHLIVCLGDHLEYGSPSIILANRLNEIIKLTRADPAATILLVGARTKDDHLVVLTEAEAMRRYLVEREPGLETRIIMEDHTSDTLGELLKLHELLDTGAVQFEGEGKITIVASDYYDERVKRYVAAIFPDRTDIQVLAAPVPLEQRSEYSAAESERLVQAEIQLAKIKPGDTESLAEIKAGN